MNFLESIRLNTSTLTTKLLFAYITVVLFGKTEIRSKIPKVDMIHIYKVHQKTHEIKIMDACIYEYGILMYSDS